MNATRSKLVISVVIVYTILNEGIEAIKRQKLTYNFALSGVYTNVGQRNVIITPSLSHCCVECFMDTGCHVVGYEAKDNLCSLHDLTILSELHASTSGYIMDYYFPTCPTQNAEYWYESTSDSCLSLRRPRMTWTEAEQNCSKDGAHVMYMRSQGEYDFLAEQLKLEDQTGKKFWVGGAKTGNETFTWTSGEIIGDTNGGQYWLDGKPKLGVGMEHKECVRLRSNPDLGSTYTNGYGMENKNCSETHQFYCQLDN